MSDPVDRRGLLALGLAAGAGLVLPGVAAAEPAPMSETDALAELLATERLTIAVGGRVLLSPHLGRRAAAVTRRIIAAEHQHAAAIEQALRRAGAAVPAAGQRTADELDRALLVRHVHRSLSDLHDEHHCLDLLLDLEGIAEGLLYTLMPQITHPAHQRLVAGLMASEAQHEALLGLLRNPKDFYRAAPYAFIEGIAP